MKIPEYRLAQAELAAVCLRLESVAHDLIPQNEADAHSSVRLAMDSIQLAKDWLDESNRTSLENGGSYRNARRCFSLSLPAN